MSRFEKFFFSMKTMMVLLLLYGISMAVATFIENDFDTATAKTLIYDAKWFEILMLWLIAIFVGNIKTYRLTRRDKWPVLVFHLAFILLFVGGAVTRYLSFEGQMPIKQGETTNQIVSDKSYFKLEINDGNMALRYDKNPYTMSHFNAKDSPWPLKRTFKQDYLFQDKKITMRTLDYIPMAKDSIVPTTSGKKMLEVVTMGEAGRESEFLSEGDIKNIGGTMVSYNNPIEGSIQLSDTTGNLTILSPLEGQYVNMAGQQMGMVTDSVLLASQSGDLAVNIPVEINNRALYTINNTNLIIPKPAFQGKVVYYKGDKTNQAEKNLPAIIVAELSSGNEKDTVMITGGRGVTGYSKNLTINGLNVALGYGSKFIDTPFSVRCDEFVLDRYPGSDNPSSYESMLTVIDGGQESSHHVYMNNVMDYRGYRFFQSSYFPDESGTILSVNADWWGTNITYIGYFLLFGGMFVTLFWKGTRFWKLNSQLKKMHARTAILIPFLLWMGIAQAQETAQPEDQPTTIEQAEIETIEDSVEPTAQFAAPHQLGDHHIIDLEHADKFGHLLVQDFEGRIKPMNTHTLELLRKIYKKDAYRKDKDTKITSEQWFLSVQIDPASWANEPMFFVGNKGGQELLNQTKADDKAYTSYLNLVNPETGEYLLENQYRSAFAKRAADQSQYDKEVIKLTERFNVFNNIVYGYYTKVIPVKNDPAESWTSWIYSTEENPIEIDKTAYEYLSNYFNSIKEGMRTDNWADADKSLSEIEAYQHEWGKNVLPPQSKIDLEVLYNKANIFLWLMIVYSLVGFALVFFAFMEVLSEKERIKKITHNFIRVFMGILIVAFVIQIIGLAVRWYLSGHAPWSNGYEAIVFISATGVLAGLLLYRNRNAFIPAAGALVAMIMMGFAHGGAMLDPQITPLAPVLKSYWLMVHVAIITSSYGFFGLSAVTAVIALILMSMKNTKKIKKSVSEITIVNEMSMTVGIFALTIGTFLGGMWANESWGRYWSWDPKETWAFISVIFYAAVVHMRLVPGLRGKWAFNAASMWVVWTIIMTYFGVNYYLDGLHTYATGDKIPIPGWIYATAAGMLLLTLISNYLHKRGQPEKKKKVRAKRKPVKVKELQDEIA